MMAADMKLAGAFADEQSAQAFETLLSRRINLVYSAALRQVRDVRLAEEVTQAVFIILARKTGSIKAKSPVSGWLYRIARYVAIDALKIQRHRQNREQEAHMESISDSKAETFWDQLMPLLDEAMAQLRDKDCDAVVLRFFENKSLREVSEVLGLEEDAAQRQIHRAVDKLRNYLLKRGVASPTTIMTGLISANAVQAAPPALAKTISVVAMGKGATAGSSLSANVTGASSLMAWAKAKITLMVGAAVIIVLGTAVVAIKGVIR